MIPDSRGPTISRAGFKYVKTFTGDEGRVFGYQIDVSGFRTVVVRNLTIVVTDITGVIADVPFASPWTAAQLPDIHVVRVPEGTAMYLLHAEVAPQKLTYNRSTGLFAFAAVSFTSTPTEWTGTNYPATGDFYQGRLFLAATPAEPQTIWASQSGLPEDFSVSSPVVDSDAITINISAFGRIKWVKGAQDLLAGTENSEQLIKSNAGVITPADHYVSQQSSYGSANIQAEQVGDQVFYVSPDRTKVRATQYVRDANSWMSVDTTHTSEHITAAKIKAIEWQQNPNNLLWCLLDDGTFATMTYERTNNVNGWATNDTGSVCEDICIGSIEGNDIIGMLTKRSAGNLYYESEDATNTHHMDSWIEQDFSPAETAITGLSHLEGEVVQIVADGAVRPDQTVSSGEITLVRAAENVVVGRKFIPKIVMLPIEAGTNIGTSAPFWKNLFNVNVHLVDSAHPTVNGVRQPTRSPSTPMNTSQPLATGKSFVAVNEWGNETDITIEQDLPLPMKITAVSGEINQEKL